MEKTYFEQLLDLIGEQQNPDAVTTIVINDVYKRTFDWLEHYEVAEDGFNTPYIQRQLNYLQSWLDRKE